MSVDIPFIISNVIIGIVTFALFSMNYMIYKKVSGGSHAYLCWTYATLFMFIYAIIAIVGGFVVAEEELDSSNINEMFKLVALTITAIGYFYIPLGILYIGSDLGIYHIDQKKIKQLQIVYFVFLLAFFTIFFGLIFNYYVVKTFRTTFDLIFTIVWIFTFVTYLPYYKMVKNTGRVWDYLFIGLASTVGQSIATLFRDAGIFIFQYVMIVFQLLLCIFFILAFYKLGKTLQAF